MKIAGLALAAVVVLTPVVSLQVIGGAQAQPTGPMPMQMPGGMMSPQQMNAQMQAHMAQMNARVKALRQQLDKINPDLLTGQERPMYEYLKLLQTHLETMNAAMGSMQGMMMQMGR
jgi:hypothetical protein